MSVAQQQRRTPAAHPDLVLFVDCPKKFWGRLTNRSDVSGLPAVQLGRKSTPDPRYEHLSASVEDQYTTLDQVEAELRYLVVAKVIEDNQGASEYSKKLDRDKWEWIVKTIEDHDIAVLSLYALSRATRRLRIFGELMELCRRKNVLIALQFRLYDPRDPRDAAYLASQAVRDEQAVLEQRESSKRGIVSAAKRGRPHGRNPYGYIRRYGSRRQLVAVTFNHDEALVILEIARRVLAGEPHRSIADDLERRRLSGEAGAQRPAGGRWHPTEIGDICKKLTYRGLREHNDAEEETTAMSTALWPAIFTKATAAKLDAHFARMDRGSHSTNAKYLLTGVIVCGHCNDHEMYYQESRAPKGTDFKPQFGYTCSCRIHSTHETDGRAKWCKRTINAENVEGYVVDVVNNWLADPRVVAQKAGGAADVDTDPQIKTDQAALDDLVRQIANADRYTPAAVAAVRGALQPQIDALDESIKRRRDALADGPRGWAHAQRAGLQVLPEDLEHRRAWLKELVVVRILSGRKGRGFDLSRVKIIERH